MPSLLVTGGNGYLGSEVVRLAKAGRWQVVAPSRREVDVRDEHAVAAAAAGVDAIVHAAVRASGDDAWSTNVEGSAVVARVARKTGARLVHVSTDLVFDGTAERPYREDDEPHPILPYGEAKLAAERAVLAELPDAVVVRTSVLYGKDVPGPQERLVLDALDRGGDITFFTDEIRSATHVTDLAAALVELVEVDVSGVLHVAGPEHVSRHALACAIATTLGRDPAKLRHGASTGSARPRNVSLDTTRARAVLRTTMRRAHSPERHPPPSA